MQGAGKEHGDTVSMGESTRGGEEVRGGDRVVIGCAREEGGGCVHTGCWLAALGTYRRRLRGGVGGQLAAEAVMREA